MTLHCKVEPMDRTQMVARLVSELGTARAAITASYLRLWRPVERAVTDTDDVDRVGDISSGHETGARREERPRRDAASGERACR
jgi:hypothetical protein